MRTYLPYLVKTTSGGFRFSTLFVDQENIVTCSKITKTFPISSDPVFISFVGLSRRAAVHLHPLWSVCSLSSHAGTKATSEPEIGTCILSRSEVSFCYPFDYNHFYFFRSCTRKKTAYASNSQFQSPLDRRLALISCPIPEQVADLCSSVNSPSTSPYLAPSCSSTFIISLPFRL